MEEDEGSAQNKASTKPDRAALVEEKSTDDKIIKHSSPERKGDFSKASHKGVEGKMTPPYTVHVAIQACDYSIERSNSILPSRRHCIPARFRDYEDPDYLLDQGDDDYHPPVVCYKSGRGRGRPRKNASSLLDNGEPKTVDNSSTDTAETNSNMEKKTQQKQSRLRSKKSIENDLYKQRPYRCLEEGCGQTFITVNWLNRHKEQKHRGKESEHKEAAPEDKLNAKRLYKCTTCDKTFTLQGNLKTHIQSHSREKQFGCDLCTKTFGSADSLKRHKMSHLGIKPYECDECTAKFTSNVALHEHKLIHRDLKPYQCGVCARIFRQISVYQRHLLTHKGEMKFKCEICGRRFMQNIYLRSHMKKHTGERPYKCDLCDKRFAHASDKARHQKTHSGEKPYGCNVCQARFTDPSSCRRHMKEHSGELPFTCEKCGEKFKRKISLRAHVSRHHGSEVLQEAIVLSGAVNDVSNVDLCMINENKLVLLGPDGQQLPVITQMLYNDNNERVVKLFEDKTRAKGEGSMVLVQEDVEGERQQVVLTAPQASDIKEEELVSAATQQIIREIGSQLTAPEGVVNDGEGQQVQVAYHVIQNDDNHQIVEIQYQPVKEFSENRQDIACDVDDNEVVTDGAREGDDLKSMGSTTDIIEPAAKMSLINSNAFEHKYAQNAAAPSALNVQFRDSGILGSVACSKANESVVLSNAEIISTSQPSLGEVLGDAVSDVEQLVVGHENNLSERQMANGEEVDHEEENKPDCILDSASGDILNAEMTKMYIDKPDFGRQEYYNWLAVFNDQCKQTPVPLSEQTFKYISQLHKTLTDMMASPSGILAHKDNFRILMGICQDLAAVINEHLVCVLQTLEKDT